MTRAGVLALLTLAACGVPHTGMDPLAEREVHVVPGTPIPPPADDPATAALERWLPARSHDVQLRALVDEAMRSGRGRKVADRALQTVTELGAVRQLVVEDGLPDLFVGIPYWESNFTDDAVSRSCAAGPWQLMPETAFELGVDIQNCTIGGAVWSPTPGVPASPSSPYRGAECGISSCEVDGRTDLAQSTRAAVRLLDQMWRSKEMAQHPDRAGLVVIAYNTGFGALKNHVARTDDPLANLQRCADGGCSTLSAQGAHYLPGVVAAAALATCAASGVPDTRFTQDHDTALCQSLRLEGLVPDTRGASLRPTDPSPRG